MSRRHCALEKLLAEAEKVVIDFYDIREHVMDIKTLEGDIEAGTHSLFTHARSLRSRLD